MGEEKGSHDPNDVPPGRMPELRIAAVFNSLRVLIDIVRPMLQHPQRQNQTLTMKHGPSMDRRYNNDSDMMYYLLSKQVYSCVSVRSWKTIQREYMRLLDEVQDGLAERMSKFNNYDDDNDDVRHILTTRDWIASVFDRGVSFPSNDQVLANICRMEWMHTSSSSTSSRNPEGYGASLKILHAALFDRFKENTTQQSLLQSSVNRLKDDLTFAITRMFRGAYLTVYGSCLSGLALEGSHDVDVSVYLPELDKLKTTFHRGEISDVVYENKMRRILFKVRDSLKYYHNQYRLQFFDLLAIPWARVPVIKGKMYAQNPYTQDGSLAFDLCFLNDIAVVNSSLLREYSLCHENVRILMLSIKSFAKTCGIANAAEGTLSSYSWLNMVVFYLQCIGMVPVLQCPILMKRHEVRRDLTNPWHCVDGLDTVYLTMEGVRSRNVWQPSPNNGYENVGMLLTGFFNFYASIFPNETMAVSVRVCKLSLPKTALHATCKLWRIAIEDPFETWDSHMPHDLGCHVQENGMKRIYEALRKAKNDFEGMLCGTPIVEAGDDGAAVSSLLCSWLGPPKLDTKNIGAVDQASTATLARRSHPQGASTHGRKHHTITKVCNQAAAGVNGGYSRLQRPDDARQYTNYSPQGAPVVEADDGGAAVSTCLGSCQCPLKLVTK